MAGETIVDAIAWCRKHNAMVRFESNGTVTVKMNGARRRRATLVEAVRAHVGRKTFQRPRCGWPPLCGSAANGGCCTCSNVRDVA